MIFGIKLPVSRVVAYPPGCQVEYPGDGARYFFGQMGNVEQVCGRQAADLLYNRNLNIDFLIYAAGL
jgi:hypothetical protein